MQLQRMTIEGYRSLQQQTVLHFDRRATIILGANDHGKSNLLHAIRHLNADEPFDEERDLNWDVEKGNNQFPKVEYVLDLTEEERGELLKFEQDLGSAEVEESEVGEENDDDEDDDPETVDENGATAAKPPELAEIPKSVCVSRVGIDSDLTCTTNPALSKRAREHLLSSMLPRVELIEPWDKIPDGVTFEEINVPSHEFMRGIFYYADLDPKSSEALFEQDDRSKMTLNKASSRLNETLRASWSQGQDLNFVLWHDSADVKIDLRIQDPSVDNQYVRASRRSSGFTHYFAMKTILHARQVERPANKHIWLFDEPGIYLHPSGQHDLLQVLERLSRSAQIVYTTHSVFMINRNHPTRHRLVSKNSSGTVVNTKPYSGRWGAVLSALGLSLTNPMLFAKKVLLVEGDSDPIYCLSILQKLLEVGEIDVDLNTTAIVSTGESRNAEVFIRLLFESDSRPKVAMLFDGDKGGADRKAALRHLTEQHNIKTHTLPKGTSIEDHLIAVNPLFIDAVADYACRLSVTVGKTALDKEDARARFLKDFDSKFDAGRVTENVIQWAEDATKDIGGFESKPSKVGIAREYAELLSQKPPNTLNKKEMQRASTLANWIISALELGSQEDTDAGILAKERHEQ